jgi:hypothetical protein
VEGLGDLRNLRWLFVDPEARIPNFDGFGTSLRSSNYGGEAEVPKFHDVFLLNPNLMRFMGHDQILCSYHNGMFKISSTREHQVSFRIEVE